MSITVDRSTIYTLPELQRTARQAMADDVKAAGKRLRDFKLKDVQLVVHEHGPTLRVYFQNLRDGWVSSINVAI